ncbi:CHC2 zinc finger domain-containing protein [Flavilitoribacter nigricans]|nr:CHC2 zinc finger domain-containing protein [Flavilitoribacter nigricans]
MLSTPVYIPKETAEKIKDAAVLTDIVQDFAVLKKQGSSMVGDCPHCHAKKFTLTPGKKIYKCFSGCEKGGNNAVQFLTEMIGKTYQEALLYLADRYNIAITEEKKTKATKAKNRKMKFRDQQLRDSGISEKEQKWFLHKNDANATQVEADRYQAASIDRNWNVVAGDDMVLHYLGLDGQPIKYKANGAREQMLIRVRWANPDLHRSKDGNPMKYQSPYGSGSHLWLPNLIIKAVKQEQIIETLYICEGEKKADKMCLHGMPAVGVMGIHNFATANSMPAVFEQIIKKCAVANVMFVLDADWQDISVKNGKPADTRPKTFFKAVMKFRDYFYSYSGSGVYLNIYFGYGKNKAFKGMDDVLVRELKEKEAQLAEDFKAAMIDREGSGEHVQVHKITEMSDYKLKEFWYLHSNPAFLNHYREELKGLHEFKLGRLRWRYNENEDKFELAQKILPHEQYWTKEEWEDRGGNNRVKYVFNYTNCRHFLRNRGYGLYEHQPDQFRFIHVDSKIVKETTAQKIRRYVMEFTEEIEEKDVLEVLLRGGKQYLGPDKLSDMYQRDLQFMQSDKDCMFLFFKTTYWKITANDIEQRPLSELPHYVWKDKINDFEPTYIGKPMVEVTHEDKKWKLKIADEGKACDMLQFYNNTSMFHWKKLQKLAEDDGKKYYDLKSNTEEITPQDIQLHRSHLVTKMIAAGYVMHDYRDYANMKAIVCMDGIESEVGRSQGGTGKSLWSLQFEQLVPTEVVDGKKKNIEDDNHLYELVDERTHLIIFDDVRVNFPFEWLFSQITRGVEVNPKGERRTKLPPKKFIINTNHAINGEGNSFRRRQYPIAFSDYYNQYRTVGDDFGYQLFHEWDNRQWNLFYNFIATCIQVYLQFGLDHRIPEEDIERRRQRQNMGEKFLDWANLVFDQEPDHTGDPIGIFLNKTCERNYLYGKFLDAFPSERRYCDSRQFKEKLQVYCEYAGLAYNPTAKNDRLRIKSNGKEYFLLTNNQFDASRKASYIDNDDDLRGMNLPFNK